MGASDEPVTKTECTFDLVDRGALSEVANVLVESGAVTTVYEFCVDEHESFGDVEANGDDVFGIFERKFVAFF